MVRAQDWYAMQAPAQDWYAIEAPAQVERFADELAAAVERIRARPLLFAALRQDVRRSHLNVFPHEVWYLVHEHQAEG